jgi:hypothetical protein
MMSKRKNWIQQAIRKPGAFRKQARRAGKSTMEFAREVVRNPERYDTTTVRRARLALTLSKFRKRGKRK